MDQSLRRAGVLWRVLLAVVVASVIAVTAVVLIMNFRPGGQGAADWAARQVVSIVERSIVPQIGFRRFEYESPRTLRFLDLTLTAPDGTVVAQAAELAVTLTAVPRLGQAVEIERIGVRAGLLNMVETRDAEGGVGFRGLVPFVKPGPTTPTPNQNFAAEPRLSDVLRISRVMLEDCGLVYRPASGAPPLRLAGITTELSVSEAIDDDEGRWHTFELELARGSAMDAHIAGRLDLDELVLDLAPSFLRFDLTAGAATELPPAIQTLLAQHEASGEMEISVSGRAPVRDITRADLRAGLELSGFNVAFGEYRLPIVRALFEARLAGGLATLRAGDLSLLEGNMLVQGELDLREERRPLTGSWSMTGVQLREILRGGTPDGQPPKLAGVVTSAGSFGMNATEGAASILGEGTIDIVQGRFVGVTIVGQLVRLINITNRNAEPEPRSEAKGVFRLRGPAADFSEVALKTPLLSARGEGVLWFDGRMDFVVNAGPLERVQDLLGGFGRIFGAVTDQLVKYRVSGTIQKPEVKVLPLGVGASVDRGGLP